MLMSSRSHRGSPAQTREQDSFIFPVAGRPFDDPTPDTSHPISTSLPKSSVSSTHSMDLSASGSSLASIQTGARTPTRSFVRSPFKPSGLSLLLARQHESSSQKASSSSSDASAPESMSTAEQHPEEGYTPSGLPMIRVEEVLPPPLSACPPPQNSRPWRDEPHSQSSMSDLTETAPLLDTAAHPSYCQSGREYNKPIRTKDLVKSAADRAREIASLKNLRHILITSVKSLPAVVLGSLLNILDGVSCT